MIGKFIVFVAVAVSSSAALPFGSCGPWDSPAFGNFVGGPANVIPNTINLPGPAPVIEGPAFPSNNILTPTTTNIIPSNIITPTLPNNVPPFPPPTVPGPSVSGPITVQRFAGPISFPNIPFSGHIVQTPPIHVQNIETRVPTIQTRIPTIQARFPSFDGALPGFSSVQGTVFQGSNTQLPC